jgi:hypothetical protein
MTPADASTRRKLALIDSGTSLVIAMLAWPFPLARAYLPVWAIIAGVLVFWQVIQVLYHLVAIGFWGATGGMALLGLELCGEGSAGGRPPGRAAWSALEGLLCAVFAIVPGLSVSRALSPDNHSHLTLSARR